MWQIQTFNFLTRRWENFGKASVDFSALYKRTQELQEAGHKTRLAKVPEETEASK